MWLRRYGDERHNARQFSASRFRELRGGSWDEDLNLA
jgi:hypothetical protein